MSLKKFTSKTNKNSFFSIGLPPELQTLGNGYVRDEFKRHKTCNEAEAKVFMVEWTNYAVQLSQQLGIRGKPKEKIGENLKPEDLDSFKEDQIVQLYELLKAAKEPDETANDLEEKPLKKD